MITRRSRCDVVQATELQLCCAAVLCSCAVQLCCVCIGGSFKEIELSRLSQAKPAKVYLTKVWFGLSRLSWTRSTVHDRPVCTANSTERDEIPGASLLSLAERG